MTIRYVSKIVLVHDSYYAISGRKNQILCKMTNKNHSAVNNYLLMHIILFLYNSNQSFVMVCYVFYKITKDSFD